MRSLGLDIDGPIRWGSVPSSQAAGVFIVELATPLAEAPLDQVALRRWLERVPGLRLDGERPTPVGLGQRLASFWVPGQSVLYVGRSARSLAGRVGALYATELGHRRPHSGGHWLKTLRDPQAMRLWWSETEAVEEYEDALIGAFAESLPPSSTARPSSAMPIFPWANLESPSGGLRETGLRDFLLSVDATPPKASAVLRSDRATGSPRRRVPSAVSAAPRAPRRTTASPTGAAAPGGSAPRESVTHLTVDGLAAVQAELDRLVSVERPQVVERIKHARELGDLRENADYEAARNEQSFLEGRILELERQLRTAVVIGTQGGTSIGLGSRVRYEMDGTTSELTLVGTSESDPASGRISAASPVGRALLGKRAGDEVVVTTPSASIHYRILDVG
jgi:transcription elongation factor GreA